MVHWAPAAHDAAALDPRNLGTAATPPKQRFPWSFLKSNTCCGSDALRAQWSPAQYKDTMQLVTSLFIGYLGMVPQAVGSRKLRDLFFCK